MNDRIVIALAGLPGAGKTSVANALIADGRWSLISRDAIRRTMFAYCLYTDVEKQAAFDAVCLAVEANLQLGQRSIIDGMPFSRVGELERIAEIVARYNGRLVAFLIEVSIETAIRRVESDRSQCPHLVADDRNRSLVEKTALRIRDFPFSVHRLDGERPLPSLVAEVSSVVGSES